MKAQHVWAEAATMAGEETVSKSKKGGFTMWRKLYPGRISVHAVLLALIVLTVLALPVYAAKINISTIPGNNLETAVSTATSGDEIVLDVDPAPIINTIPVNEVITIQGYDTNPCEILPTDRVIGGQPDTCYDSLTTFLDNPDFEAGDDGNWLFTAIPVPPIVPDVSYTPPTSADVITEEGEPEEGTWHAVYEIDPRGAPVELQYQDPIPTLPQTISEEVRWTTSATNLCNIMDLTTESTYTLPVLPPTLVENFHSDAFPVSMLSNHFHLWLQVLQYSGHPDDKIEVFINGVLADTAGSVNLNAWETAGTWTRWHLTLAPALPVTPADVRVQVTTRTDVVNPTLVLMGSIEVNDTVAPGVPAEPNSINLFEYSSNLGPLEMYAKSLFDLVALGVPPLPAPMSTQMFLARAGGLGDPYIAASIRRNGALALPPGTDSVELMFENHEFGDIPLTTLPAFPAACGRYVFPLPSHLMNVPGRPRIRVSLTSAGAAPTVWVDDFTLSYVTKALEAAYPVLASATNIIPNGDFENGNFPFLIESPIATPVNCPHISEVIQPYSPPDTQVCSDTGFTAEFKPMLNLVLWMRCPQTSGLNTDIVRVLVDGTEIGTVSAGTLGAAWEVLNFSFTPANPNFTVALRSEVQTDTATPSLFLLGALDIQFGPAAANALPGPTARKITDFLPADMTMVTVISPAIDPVTDLPPRIFNAPLLAVSGQTLVLRFGGIGTTLKFQMKLMSDLVPGNSTLAVLVDGAEEWSISDGDASLSDTCVTKVVAPNAFPTSATDPDFSFSFLSSVLPNPAPFDPTEFFVDNVCLSYCAIRDTLAAQLDPTNLVPLIPCFQSQLSEGNFEGTPSNEWTVLPAAVAFTDVVKSAESCLGALPNTAAVFSGIETNVPTWELALEQGGIVMPATAPDDLELKFRLNTLKDGGATPGTFKVEVDSIPVFTRSSDDGGTGTYNEYSVNINGARGMTVPIRFIATIPRSTTPAAFALDHIEICKSGALGGALFRVDAGGDLTLQSVTLEQAATGVEVQGGIAKLLQTKMRDLDGTAVEVTGGQAFLASAVLHGNRANGVHVNGGMAAVLQSTIRDNGGAGVLVDSGTAHIAASLLDTNGQGIVVNAPGTAASYVNWVENNDNAATAVANFTDMDALAGKPQYSDSPWRGKLKTPLLPAPDEPKLGSLVSRIITSSGLPNLGGWTRDFECDLRPSFESAQVGADHVDPTPVQCAVDSLGADQQPHLPADNPVPVPSNTTGAYVREHTPNVVQGSVSYITWWGLWKDGATPCTPPDGANTQFEIESYGGTDDTLISVKPKATLLTDYDYGGGNFLYKYEYAFDRDQFFRGAYISIRAVATGPCLFYWMTSADGLNLAEDGSGTLLNTNFSLCVSEYSVGDECSGSSSISHPPVYPSGPPIPATQSTDILPVYVKVDSTLTVGIIEFWGIWLTDEATPMPCTPPDSPSLAVTYVNNTDLDSGTITPVPGKFIIPDAEVTGPPFITDNGDNVQMYRYAFIPDPVININNGEWLSVHQIGGATDTCRFYWVHSNDGPIAHTWDGTTDADLGVKMSHCMGLSLPGATIDDCSVDPPILGKDQPGTLTLNGTSLYTVNNVYLIPQTYSGSSDAERIDLLNSSITQSITYSGEMGTTMKIKFRLQDPFNTAADGMTTICTDGRATFETTPPGATTCDILIDTVEPVLVTIDYGNPVNAATGSPSITATREPPFGMPGNWVPGFPLPFIPKNNAVKLTDKPMHVYLNAGSRPDVTYTDAETSGPDNNLVVTVTAYFADTEPNDGTNTYPVEISGFINTPLPMPGLSPYDLPPAPDDKGVAHWNGTAVPFLSAGANFNGTGTNLTAVWNVEYTYAFEPWNTSFSLEAIDLAGNEGSITYPDNKEHSITLHWLYRTKAKFQNNVDMTVENPEVYWRLDRATADLPDAKPECAPLALFRLYTVDVATGALMLRGICPWRMDTLRGSSMFGSISLRQLLDQYQGSMMCLAIWGADETGNVQFDPGTYPTLDSLTELSPLGAEVNTLVWMNGDRRTPNLAVDTTLRLELYHEKSSNMGLRYRNYGAAQRIPLPPLAEACDTRVNADIAMKALVPTADAPVALLNGGILWKLYKEGALVARGTVPLTNSVTPPPPPWIQYDMAGTVYFPLMTMLDYCTGVGTVAELSDYDGALFKTYTYLPNCLYLNTILGIRPDECQMLNDFSDVIYRLGDEGNPPALANPNAPSQRRREIQYTLTAQTVVLYRYFDPTTGTDVEDLVIDATPATNNFSIYVREVEDQLRDETPVREFGR